LKEAVSLPVMHLSVYGLKLSEQSSWGKRYLEGSLTLPDDEISAEMQELAMDYLEGQGFVHYEIANFSRPGFFSVHNRVYWNNENYLGLGIAAASHFANYRKTNTGSLTDYISDLNRGRFPEAEWETLNRETEMAETIFLGLRLLDGLSFEAFEKRFGIDFCHRYEKQLGKLKGLGLVEHDQERIRLTKKGIFLANEVFVEFLP
jgi:oxygen-independent coproporphyrinogen-3 oxidase